MRKVTIDQLKQILVDLPANPRIVASGNFATPRTLLAAADEVIAVFRLFMINAHPGIPDRDGVTYESPFVGPGMRRHPRLSYVPCRLSLVPVLFRDHYIPDVVLLNTSTVRHDTVSLGTEVNILPAAIEAARKHGGIVVAQANSKMPYTYGDAQLYEHEIDYLIEVDEDLGLANAGALDADLPITASFIFGSRELYDWVDLNKGIRMLRTERTNDPAQIAKQAKMTSINSALQVDLYDQANASHVRGQVYSGFGGSTDFIVGALHARGGRSFIALPSWHQKANVSTIVPRISEYVTSFQHSHVVTEQGVADCFGHSEKQQAHNLIENAAHPDARDELRAVALKMGLL